MTGMATVLSAFVAFFAPQNPPAPKQTDPDDKRSGHQTITKEEIITASPLKPLDVFDTPYSADVVSGSDIQGHRLSRTTPEALKEMPGVSVQKTGPGQGSPFIRGWSGFRNVMLIDGIRLNNSTFREGPNQYWGTVDSFLIDRLELVRGPSSVLYGSDSIGGTVYAHTKEPKDFQPGFHIHERTVGRYASAEQSYTVRQETWGNLDDAGWFVGGTYRDFNDIDGGRHYGEMKGTGYDEYDADVKFLYRASKNSKVIVAAQRHRMDDASRWHSTLDYKSWHGTSVINKDRVRDFDQERDLYYFQYHWAAEGGIVDAFKASLSWHRQAERENRVTSTGAREVRAFDVETPGLWLQAGKKTDFGYFTGGAEYYHDSASSSGHDWSSAGALTWFPRGAIAGEGAYDLFGVYLQDEFSIGALDITPGVRFTHAAVEADDVDNIPGDAVVFPDVDDTYQAVTGGLRFLYHVNDHWNAITGWGMGFRTPSLTDLTSIKLKLSGIVDVPAPDLDPERMHTFDLGVRARYPQWELSAFTFYTIIDEAITRTPAPIPPGAPAGVTAAFGKDNVGGGYVYGFEVAALYRLTEEVFLFADWGYAKGEAEQIVSAPPTGPTIQDEQPLGKVGPSMLHLGARYEPQKSKVWVEGIITAAAHQHHLAPSEGSSDAERIPPGGTPGYTTCTLRGGYDITEHASVTAAVENITNKDYRIHGSGQNEPGTNFILGLDVRF